ncbi:uncharacterized protein G2W53_009859 [Senna tora]|uniref:Uncharacterized protein n=1 Tax=Senna tora TaxID=362788 RepID=A0A834WZC3_9FABA|nr:uncharacterized protein G2W53_009859 [Senna tora]
MSVDHVLTYSGRQITVGSQKPSRITRQKTCCASESNTWVLVVFENRSIFDALIGVVLHGRNVDHVLTYSAREIAVGFRNLHELRGKRLVAQVSQTHRFALYSQTGVVLMLRLESSWHGRTVDHVLTYSGRHTAVGSQKHSRISRQKTCCASESITSVRVVFVNGSGKRHDPQMSQTRRFALYSRTIVVLMLRLESSWLGRSMDHVLTYSGRQIAVGYQKPSRITRQKTCCTSESNTSIRVVFANGSSFDAPIGVVLAWEERGSCPNIFRMTNRGRISETFTNYEAKDLLRK